MHARVVLGVGKGVLFRGCPQFKSVLIEREVPLKFILLSNTLSSHH